MRRCIYEVWASFHLRGPSLFTVSMGKTGESMAARFFDDVLNLSVDSADVTNESDRALIWQLREEA